MCKVVIIGAGGHAKVIADIVIKSGDTLLGFLDDNKVGKVIGEYSVIGKISDAPTCSSDAEFIIAIGSNVVRKEIAEKLDLKWYTAVHPSAQIGYLAEIGAGSCVMANAVINSDATVGMHSIINTGAVVEHDCRVSDFVHISPNATLCGTVTVGTKTWIGAGTTVINNIRICDNCVIGAGAVVVRDVITSGTYLGIPAKIRNNPN